MSAAQNNGYVNTLEPVEDVPWCLLTRVWQYWKE